MWLDITVDTLAIRSDVLPAGFNHLLRANIPIGQTESRHQVERLWDFQFANVPTYECCGNHRTRCSERLGVDLNSCVMHDWKPLMKRAGQAASRTANIQHG